MQVLLDTHALLWFLLDDPKLSRTARAIISDAQIKVSVSPATYWEIAIKISLGKYTLAESYEVFIEQELARNDFGILPILPRHTAILIDLPFHHRDPFDRLLIAQAIAEQIPLVSCDEDIDHYRVTRLW
jgi:PIN domain nuclease of toxin-antitoxin system